MVSASTGEATWKAVRKGIAPAFAQSNVRWACVHLHGPEGLQIAKRAQCNLHSCWELGRAMHDGIPAAEAHEKVYVMRPVIFQ